MVTLCTGPCCLWSRPGWHVFLVNPTASVFGVRIHMTPCTFPPRPVPHCTNTWFLSILLFLLLS